MPAFEGEVIGASCVLVPEVPPRPGCEKHLAGRSVAVCRSLVERSGHALIAGIDGNARRDEAAKKLGVAQGRRLAQHRSQATRGVDKEVAVCAPRADRMEVAAADKELWALAVDQAHKSLPSRPGRCADAEASCEHRPPPNFVRRVPHQDNRAGCQPLPLSTAVWRPAKEAECRVRLNRSRAGVGVVLQPRMARREGVRKLDRGSEDQRRCPVKHVGERRRPRLLQSGSKEELRDLQLRERLRPGIRTDRLAHLSMLLGRERLFCE
mmetsp:Transcript_36355/g.120390  ORF Transcript_36355/g.120390 Transcript_36355/m.120390 type:complete len:266 (-) Transcript_36355:2478-3275(-)